MNQLKNPRRGGFFRLLESRPHRQLELSKAPCASRHRTARRLECGVVHVRDQFRYGRYIWQEEQQRRLQKLAEQQQATAEREKPN